MGKKSKKTKRNTELRIIFFIILVALATFIISTYAWFSTQRNVSITNLNGTVEVAEGLEISLDALNWTNGIVLGEGEGKLNIMDDAYTGHRNVSPSEMLPVSTLGLVNEDTMKDLKMLRGKLTNSIELTNVIVTDETEDDPENMKFPGYFAFDIFLKNSSKNDDVEDILQLNYDSSLQIMPSAEEGVDKSGTGLQNTVRVAFAKYGGVVGTGGVRTGVSDVMASQETILKETGAAADGDDVYISDVAIWEPNSSDHVQYIVDNNNRITWSTGDAAKYAVKTLPNGKKGFDLTTKMPTHALSDDSVGVEKIADVYNWSGTNSTTMKQQVVIQTTKTSATDYTIAEGVKNLKSTSDATLATDFTIAPNSVIRLRVYVWLEGQDVDCINYASHGGGVTLNIGLVKGSEEGTFEPEEEE